MKPTLIKLGFILFLIPLLFSCSVFQKIDGEGPVVVREFDLNYFNELTVNGPWEVELRVSQDRKMVVESHENIIALLDQNLYKERLEIGLDQSIGKVKQKKIILYAPHFYKINASEGLVHSRDAINQEDIEINAERNAVIELLLHTKETYAFASNAQIILHGDTEYLEAIAERKAEINAQDFIAQNGVIHSVDESFVNPNIIHSAQQYASGKGVIDYYHKPDKVRTKPKDNKAATRRSSKKEETRKSGENTRKTENSRGNTRNSDGKTRSNRTRSETNPSRKKSADKNNSSNSGKTRK